MLWGVESCALEGACLCFIGFKFLFLKGENVVKNSQKRNWFVVAMLSVLPTWSATMVAKVGIGTIGATAILASTGCDEELLDIVYVVSGPVVGWGGGYYDDYYYDDYGYDEVFVVGGGYYDDYGYGYDDYGCYDPWCKAQNSSGGPPKPGRQK